MSPFLLLLFFHSVVYNGYSDECEFVIIQEDVIMSQTKTAETLEQPATQAKIRTGNLQNVKQDC
jgi:hypothetical protein